jgi:hypothetical protein
VGGHALRRAAWRIVAVCLVAAQGAHAQPSIDAIAAEQLFREGRALMQEGKLDLACSKLEASQKLDPAVGTLFSLGECYAGEGRTASAWFAYRAAASLAAHRNDNRRSVSQARADAIEPKVAKLAVHVSDEARHAGASIRVDGAPFVLDALTAPLSVDPGPHRVEATAPGHEPWSAEVRVGESGERADVVVPALISRVESRPPAPAARLRRTVGFVLVDTGTGLAALGALFGMQAIVLGRDANRACPGNLSCGNASAVGDNNRAKTYADLSTVLIPMGLAAAAIGGVFFFMAGRAEVAPTVSDHAATLDARWSW